MPEACIFITLFPIVIHRFFSAFMVPGTGILTSMIAAYRATTRMLATMAENHIISGSFVKTNNSIMIIMVVAILISILGKNIIDSFMNLASLGAVITFAYTSLSAWKLARRNGSGLCALTGVVGTLASVALGVISLIPNLTSVQMMDKKALLLLAGWCVLGIIFYLVTVARSGRNSE